MKTLVVYYSRTGHNAKLAQQVHADMPGDLDEIVDMKNRAKMFGCVMAALLHAKTQIQFGKDPAAYDQVVVVSPLWAGTLPPATRTYLAQHRGKLHHYAFLSVSGQGEENRKALQDVTATASKRPLANFLVKESEVGSEEAKLAYAAFIAQLPHEE